MLRFECGGGDTSINMTTELTTPPYPPRSEKTWFCCMRTIKAQTRLCIRAVWSAICHSFSGKLVMQKLLHVNLKNLAKLCSWAGLFEQPQTPVIVWVNPFMPYQFDQSISVLRVVGSRFSFYSNHNRTFWEQTLETLIRRFRRVLKETYQGDVSFTQHLICCYRQLLKYVMSTIGHILWIYCGLNVFRISE